MSSTSNSERMAPSRRIPSPPEDIPSRSSSVLSIWSDSSYTRYNTGKVYFLVLISLEMCCTLTFFAKLSLNSAGDVEFIVCSSSDGSQQEQAHCSWDEGSTSHDCHSHEELPLLTLKKMVFILVRLDFKPGKTFNVTIQRDLISSLGSFGVSS